MSGRLSAECGELLHDDTGQISLTVSIVIPVLDDAQALTALLGDLSPARSEDVKSTLKTGRSEPAGEAAALEIIVVDGGSRDHSLEVGRRAGVRILECCRSRGLQLDAGAQAAIGAWLWFLHADCRISPAVIAETGRLSQRDPGWGRFDVRLPQAPLLRLIAAMMNWRSACTGICTGDQGIFVHRDLLNAIGGVPRQPLMEDIELSKRLKRLARPLRMRTPIQVSARRWQTRGVLKTILFMWWLRIRYLCGAVPERLARQYYG